MIIIEIWIQQETILHLIKSLYILYRSIVFDHSDSETHSLLGAAEDLGAVAAAAHSVPRLQAVDGVPTPAKVAGARPREETGGVSGSTLTLLTNSGEVVSGGPGRRERDVGLIERLYPALCGKQSWSHHH